MHSHRHLTTVVIALYGCFQHLVHRYAKVIEGHIVLLLQLITHRPHHHRGMIAVASNEFLHMSGPQLHKGSAPCSHVLVVPFVIEFIHHQYAVLVAKVQKVSRIGVVRGAYVVHPKLFHQFDALLYSSFVGSGSQSTVGVVVGIALEQHLLAIEFQSLSWHQFHSAHAKALGGHSSHTAIGAQQFQSYSI